MPRAIGLPLRPPGAVTVLGVAGHRRLADVERIIRGVEHALDCIEQAYSDPLLLLSQLAEGADRLVARISLDRPGVSLTAVLPCRRTEYMTDFVSDESRREFEELLGRAARVVELTSPGSRAEQYGLAANVVVEASDVVIAVWDGRPSRGTGGTAESVTLARGLGIPLAWVHAEGGRRQREGLLDPGGAVELTTFERCPSREGAGASDRAPDP